MLSTSIEHFRHSNQEKFNEAKDLVVNLVQTILLQMHQEQQPQEPLQPLPGNPFHQNIRPQIPLGKIRNRSLIDEKK